MSQKIYIAGKVTGQPRATTETNFARGFRLLIAKGYEPVTPLDYVSHLASSADAMKTLVPLLLDCDGILLLQDWKFSEGARIEMMIAQYAGKQILYEEQITN
jgi:hypothetical protein